MFRDNIKLTYNRMMTCMQGTHLALKFSIQSDSRKSQQDDTKGTT